ncbi:DUF1707 and DUF4870 domain-containing protein [Propioniciclava soli]|uniref:DUF1707 and DUF4870 domain-containing protein n=1 Tax=Propioniciclava soli TaxID=2775081 RepID=A0ABZ3CAS5_9ACTN
MTALDAPRPAPPITETERQRATQRLCDAYGEGRLDEVELDERLSAALAARTRRELSGSLAGLPAISRQVLATRTGQIAGGLAHLSGLFTWILGPLLFHLMGSRGSSARAEAAKAFNFQLIAGPLFLVVAIAAPQLLPDWIAALTVLGTWLGWACLTVVGGARAFSGQPFRNPVTRIVPWEALDTRGR